MFVMRIFAIPIMILLYLGVGIPLSIVYVMDWAFDAVGWLVGFDTRYWPLPRGQDENFRFRQTKCQECRRTFNSPLIYKVDQEN